MAGHGEKISDENFWAILKENAGIYQRTATAISKAIDQPYSRQAVHDRANKKPELLRDIKEANIDIAETGLHSLMRQTDNPNIRFSAIKYFLSTIGKQRGYTEQTDINHMNVPKIEIIYNGGSGKAKDDTDILG